MQPEIKFYTMTELTLELRPPGCMLVLPSFLTFGTTNSLDYSFCLWTPEDFQTALYASAQSPLHFLLNI